MTDQTLTAKFVESFSLTDDLLTQIIKDKQPISVSLGELSKLHHLQKMLEEFQFLNIVYSDTSRVRKMILTRTKSNLNLQQQVCLAIDQSLDTFMGVFQRLDNYIFRIMNCNIQDQFMRYLQEFAQLVLGVQDFTVVFETNRVVSGISTKLLEPEPLFTKLQHRFKESATCDAKDLDPRLGNATLSVYKNKYAYLLYEPRELAFTSFPDYRMIMDQFVSVAYDFSKEIYDKEAVISVVRGIKSRFINSSTKICQEIIRYQLTNILATPCFIEMPDQNQYMNELLIDQHGFVVLPVRLNKSIKFYIKIENPSIDMITFSDYIQQLWLKLTFQLQELKNQEFLRQMLEVNSPNKLIIQLDTDGSIRYQSCCVPQSWFFMLIKGQSFDELEMESVNKNQIREKMQELKQTTKGAVTVCQINFGDKSLDLDLFAKRNEEDEITEYYLVFNAPKKKYEERISVQMASDTKLQELGKEALLNMKSEKLNKACNTFRDYLKVNLTDDEIIDLLKEKDILKEIVENNPLTDDIRTSYVMEYYKQESYKVVKDYRQEKSEHLILTDQSLNTIKRIDLFQLDQNDISNLSDYSFDITQFKDPQEQIRYTWALFHLCNYLDQYQIQKDTFYQFVVVIQEKYNHRQNPFHNFEHGFTVAHAIYYLIKNKNLNQYFDKLIQFTALVSGLCHDVDHTGRNNNFECMKLSKIAIRHNDESVLENHHCSSMFKILQKERYNILANLSPEQFITFRRYAIANILATDMKKHMDIIKQLEVKLSKLPDEPLISKEDDRKFLSGAIIHTCDLTGQSKVFGLARKWSYRIAQEFSSQVEDEMAHSLPVTPHFLLMSNPNFNQLVAKQEIGFIKHIVRPAYELTAQALQGLDVPLKNLEDNLKLWEKEMGMS